jgi:type II secretory pathway pseudopilin PulG
MPRNNSSRDRRHGLSFLDVVIVLVLIALLVALWMPMVARARERSRRQLCAQRLNMIGNAIMNYRQANGGSDPRTLYVRGARPDLTNAGAAAPDPFGPGGPPANSIPAALFLLMRVQDLSPSLFVCPAAPDGRYAPDDFAGAFTAGRSNFSDVRRNLGYSFYNAYTDATPGVQPGVVICADRNPGPPAALGNVTIQDLNANPTRYRAGNSANHGKAGQYVLFDDTSVQWFTTPFAGPMTGTTPDNIYTTRRNLIVGPPYDATDAILLPADE